MTAESGGGAFVLVYILSVIFLALPIMCAEILIGKRGSKILLIHYVPYLMNQVTIQKRDRLILE